eukprot:7376041-Prymnesium_polylepis.3
MWPPNLRASTEPRPTERQRERAARLGGRPRREATQAHQAGSEASSGSSSPWVKSEASSPAPSDVAADCTISSCSISLCMISLRSRFCRRISCRTARGARRGGKAGGRGASGVARRERECLGGGGGCGSERGRATIRAHWGGRWRAMR